MGPQRVPVLSHEERQADGAWPHFSVQPMTHEQASHHPGVLVGTHRIVRDGRRPGGYVTENIALRLASQARYIKTEKGREKRARYNGTAKRMIYNIEYAAKRRAS